MDSKILKSIKDVYYRKTLKDKIEKGFRRYKEKLLGLDYSIFNKTIVYYKEVKEQNISRQEALSRALDKKKHKDTWFTRPRNTLEDILHFYKEVDVYLFRQPYKKRFGGFRWYIHLVDHIDNPSIIEYGCGCADLTEWLIKKFKNFDFTVSDIPSATLEFVKWKKRRFKYNYTILTIGPGKEGIPLSRDYDLIICQDVLEHTPNPLEIVTSFVNHLSPGGVLITSFVNAPGGENLELSAKKRESVKLYLKKNLIAIKPIDEPHNTEGLYVKDDA